jgi:hypothetical protein
MKPGKYRDKPPRIPLTAEMLRAMSEGQFDALRNHVPIAQVLAMARPEPKQIGASSC